MLRGGPYDSALSYDLFYMNDFVYTAKNKIKINIDTFIVVLCAHTNHWCSLRQALPTAL